MEKKVKKIHSLGCSTNGNQIKGKKQLTDLSKVVNFGELENEWLKKKTINSIKSKVSSSTGRPEDMEGRVGRIRVIFKKELFSTTWN